MMTAAAPSIGGLAGLVAASRGTKDSIAHMIGAPFGLNPEQQRNASVID
jgi:hypothetical protein